MTPSAWMPLSCANMLRADDRLPHRDRAPGGGHDVLGDLAEALGVDVEVEALDVLERHDDLFERRVARALAEAADGDVDPGRAAVDAGDRVGDGHAEVVVRVHLDLEAGLLDELLDDLVGA